MRMLLSDGKMASFPCDECQGVFGTLRLSHHTIDVGTTPAPLRPVPPLLVYRGLLCVHFLENGGPCSHHIQGITL